MNAHTHVAQSRQDQASNPTVSAWVDANAGTGKTKVLTDRVLKLLLSGSGPDRILCLTFTKAAAAEMSARLARRLSAWAVASEDLLKSDLESLCGELPQEKTCEVARQLFARVLEAPGGMRIQTVHAFCQSLLRRFPLEAGVSPHFTVMEERDADLLMHETRESVLSGARAQENPDLVQALSVVISYVHEGRFNDLMTGIANDRGKFSRLLAEGVAVVSERLAAKLGVLSSDTPDTVLQRACSQSVMSPDACRTVAHALQAGGKQDHTASVFLNTWADLSTADKVAQWPDYRSLFLTQESTPRSRFPSKKVCEAYPDVVVLMQRETRQVLAVEETRKAALTLSATRALLTLAQAMMAEFRLRKERAGRMDFDDLILTTRHLLEAPSVREWVLYKLDGGVDHVLVDEAQDTSPEQWAIVRALVADFFSGEGQRIQRMPRTIFAVGDQKQSIYSFQGADPDEFERGRTFFSQNVSDAHLPFEDVALEVSFRSTAPILQAVDAVFAVPQVARGVGRLGKPVHHIPFRQGEDGRVEVWPLVMAQRLEDPPAWKPPVERIRGDSAPSRLAHLMARRIRAMTSGGDMLDSRGRPIRPGDILILVRRRSGFVEDVIRALKDLGVPVAGSDRMELTEHLAVMDLMALAHVLLLPEDDLTLACVLKGPILGLDEEQLFTLAHGRARGVTLWRALREARDTDPAFAGAYALLRGLMEKADFMPPYELFNYILGPLEGRENILARLGPDAADPLDEFLSLSLSYDRAYAPSLQGFLHWMQSGSQTIQRDFDVNSEEGPGAVRIMTVHGSKGLQAPIVFLPDTTQIPSRMPDLLWEKGEGQRTAEASLVVWSPISGERDTLSQHWADAERDTMLCEYRRLLYVAMTRAEDHLYVCGWMSHRRPSGDSWYAIIRSALEPIADAVDDVRFQDRDLFETPEVLQMMSAQEKVPPPYHGGSVADEGVSSLPSFLRVIPVSESAASRPLAPSALFDHVEGGESPLGTPGSAHARRRGRLIHSLLQMLPDLDCVERRKAAQLFVARPVWNLPSHEQDEIVETALRTLEHPHFADVFVPHALAEVPISGVIGKTVVSGVVDRLVVEDGRVLVIDFKTTRRPSVSLDEIPQAYIAQMSAYRAVLSRIWPGKDVVCGLLWTEGPSLICLPSGLLDATLPSSLTAATAVSSADSG